MLLRLGCHFGAVLLTLVCFAACSSSGGGGGPVEPIPATQTGSIQVTTRTIGVQGSLDEDGYTVAVDALPPRPIVSNGTLNFLDLSVGNHTVVLDGAAANCVIEGNPRTATVLASEFAHAPFTITCSAASGTLVIRTLQRGGIDPDGYSLSIDGGSSLAIGIIDQKSFTVAAGQHQVSLEGVRADCIVEGSSHRTTRVGPFGTTIVTFIVACPTG